MIDAHHHLWDLNSVEYPWLNARGTKRFFGDPSPIQRDYLFDEFKKESSHHGITSSVHIQVGAEDGFAEAKWIQSIISNNPSWPMVQVVFCDLTSSDLEETLDSYLELPSVVGVRQIIGRAPEEDSSTGTNGLLESDDFLQGLQQIEIYKGASGAIFGPAAIGGAINFVTDIDYENSLSFGGSDKRNNLISGNHTYISDSGWHHNIKGGTSQSEQLSTQNSKPDLDGVKNMTLNYQSQ